jgi:hypothetical protein
MRILVVGGVGYLGSIISDKLMREENEVDIFDLCLFDNFDVVKDLYKSRNPNIHTNTINSFDSVYCLLKERKYEHVVWCCNIDIEGFYQKFTKHAQQTMNLFDSIVNDIPMTICLDYKNNDIMTHYMYNKSSKQNLFWIPSLYGPSLRMRWDTVINQAIFGFLTEKTVLLGQNWMNKIPICRVAEMASVIVDSVHGHVTPFENYLEGEFSIIELVFMIKNVLDTEDSLNIQISQLDLKEIESKFGCKIDYTVQQSVQILEETVLNIKEQLTNRALPDFWNDKYNNEAVLSPIMQNLSVLEKLNG